MIVGVFGRQGSGKSTLGSVLARLVASRLGAVIYSNMEMEGAVKISRLSEIPMNRNPKVLLIDEAMFSIDSRLFAEKGSIGFTRFLAYLRKAHILLLYMTHYPMMVDQRLRLQTNFAFLGRNVGEAFEFLVVDLVTMRETVIRIPKSGVLFEVAAFDTEDFPDVILPDVLDFKVARKAGERPTPEGGALPARARAL